jgi:hypothetical protein
MLAEGLDWRTKNACLLAQLRCMQKLQSTVCHDESTNAWMKNNEKINGLH